jgi:hypothetical protein
MTQLPNSDFQFSDFQVLTSDFCVQALSGARKSPTE